MDRNEIRFDSAVIRAQHALGAAAWRKPPPRFNTWLLFNEAGKPCAKVWQLGSRLPRKERRWAASIEGVEWLTTNAVFDKPRFLTLRGFNSAKEARAAVDAARAIILEVGKHMLTNEVIEIGDRRWLVKFATSREAALSAITTARIAGSVGSKTYYDAELRAHVHQINSDGTERQPYTEAY